MPETTAAAGPVTDDAEADDWETGWEESLANLSLQAKGQKKPAASAKQVQHSPAQQQNRPQLPPGLQPHSTGAHACDSAGEDSDSFDTEEDDEPEIELPFEGRHVLEIHGLSALVQTTALEKEVIRLSGRDINPVIRRVNDDSALAVFSDPAEARSALSASAKFAMRPYSKASEAGRAWPKGELLPPRQRPKSSPVMAQRLIGHALGHRGLRSKEAERDLENQRQQKQAHTAAKKQGLEAAWAD